MSNITGTESILAGNSHDPFSILGLHREGAHWLLRVFRPDVNKVEILLDTGVFKQMDAVTGFPGIFEMKFNDAPKRPWRLRIGTFEFFDPYSFEPSPPKQDLYLFNGGKLHQAWRTLGANAQVRHGVKGHCFRVWAPNAQRVSVVGDFNQWDGRIHPMASLGSSGVWELFLPELLPSSLYRFEICSRSGGVVLVKNDPYAREHEMRPATACLLPAESVFEWTDSNWMQDRAKADWLHQPLNIYEMHAGSWMRHHDGRFYSYRELAERLIPYLKEMGYTHVEFMPLTEHPLDESWGYQCTGFFAPTSRYGSADELRWLVDQLHQAGIGVLLDWVPGHFVSDDWALAHYDGSALYEHEDPRMKSHPDWGTHIFNYGRNEVRSFLLSSAYYWLSEFHMDGLRVDAVASMLYLDYSRKAGEWTPNIHGGRENLDAIAFLRELNTMVHADFAGAITIAEESTAWPMVSRPVYLGGLGFSMKWNMGWMNDTLDYLEHDPVHRRFEHQKLTFGQLYAYSENFVLPLSHDEVVHEKGSLLEKMPGDEWQRFANLRLLLAYQIATPGKKLTFMGSEFGLPWEWRSSEELPWDLLNKKTHAGLRRLVADLNHLYQQETALHELDFEPAGFRWIDCNDVDQSVLSFERYSRSGGSVVVILNFTPVPRRAYQLGVSKSGQYAERINTDSEYYGGSNLGNSGKLLAQSKPRLGFPATLLVDLPPLSALVLAPLT